jgi:hypothetical protein
MSKDDINVLEDLETVGVSLVKRGANKKKFSFSKSEGDMNEESLEILKTILEEFPSENEAKIEEFFAKEDLSDEAKNALKGALRLLDSHKELMPKDLMRRLSSMLGEEREDDKEEGSEDSGSGDSVEGSSEKQYEEDKQSERSEMKKEDLLTSVPEELKEKVEQLWKSNQEAVKKAEAFEAALNEETDKRITKEFIQKSKDEYSNIPADSEKLGKILKTIHGFNKEVAEELESILKSVEGAIAKGSLLGEIGTSQVSSSGTVSDEVAEKAKMLVEKSESKLTFAAAYDKVLSSDPTLYKRYLNDNPLQV